jgi:hypothetical protein
MEAGIGYRASYAWRSIASARGVLKLGLSWHIGNGESVRITEDTWLPMRLPESPNSIRDILDKNERVSLLIKRGYNVWDVELVYDLFSPWVARVICSISLPPRPKQDRLF